jgi:membrane associated rhomboid family serine protease
MDAVAHEVESSGLFCVGAWDSFGEAIEHSLVILALGRDCWILENAGTYSIHTDPGDAPAIIEEFALYQNEQAATREIPPVGEFKTFTTASEFALLWAAVLMVAFYLQIRDESLTDRFSNSTSGLIANGEWWRPFTALFLHADVGHLLGNILIGGIFCVLVSQSVGALRGWLWILAGGTAANAINAWLHLPGPFESIGASTATFAALGILVGVSTRIAWMSRSYSGFKPLLLPVIAGMILLGWFGAGGENTDVAGHFLGALCGFLLAVGLHKPVSLSSASHEISQ